MHLRSAEDHRHHSATSAFSSAADALPWTTYAVLLMASVYYCLLTPGQTRDYCSTESFHGHCPSGSVILITSARYGRMRLGRCVRVDFGFIGCFTNVVSILDRICSGRPECKLRIPDAALDDTNPCIGDLTRYLEATYECIGVQSTESPTCHHGSVRLPLVLQSGYIVGPLSSQTAFLGCTRVVTASVGQRINLTLYDFGGEVIQTTPPSQTRVPPLQQGPLQKSSTATSRDDPLLGAPSAAVCRRLAMVTDVVARTVVDICSAETRLSHVYLSVGNALEIRILREPSTSAVAASGRHFVLHYEVVGCPDINLTNNYWTRRTDVHLTVGCFSSGKTWQMICKGRTWNGEFGNCSDGDSRDAVTSANYPMRDETQDLTSSMSTGLAVVVIVAIAACVGVCVAAAGILIIRRLRKMSMRRNGCLTMRGVGGDVIMKAIQREDCYQATDAQKMTSGQCRLWTYGASASAGAAQADTPYCDCYRGLCAADGASAVMGNCDDSPKTIIVTSAVAGTPLAPPHQLSSAAEVIASTTTDRDVDGPDPDARSSADFPRPIPRGTKEEGRRSPFLQPLHHVMMYDDHLYQTSGLAYRYSMQLARGIHAAPMRVTECLEHSKEGNTVTERPDAIGITGSSMAADKDCRSNDCPASG